MNRLMDDSRFYALFNSISIWADDNEMLCVIEPR